MDLSIRQLAFLEHEMQSVAEDTDRCGAHQLSASEVLGQVQDEIEKKTAENLN